MASPRHATVELVVARDPRLLLERAADGFLTPPRPTPDEPFPSPPYLLALRQGGLRDDLIQLAAERGLPGWFDPPLCVFHELPQWLGSTARIPCDDFERAVILGGVLRQLAGDVFGRLQRPEDFLGALDQLFGELIAEGVTPAAFRDALEHRPERDEFEKQRDFELAHIYAEYLQRLERAGRRDGRDTWLDCAQALAADPAAFARRLGGRREIRLFGLHDLRGGWRALLAALQASPPLDRITIYSAEPPDLVLPLGGPRVTWLEEADTIATRLFADAAFGAPVVAASAVAAPAAAAPAVAAPAGTASATAPPMTGGEIQVIAAPDVERELEEVARRIRLLADEGVPLDRIAVVARQARPYVDLAVAALARFGVPATARRRFALREVPVVRAVVSLVAAAADGWSRHTLVEVAEQPYFANELDAQVVNFAGFRRRVQGLAAWRRALHELAREAAAAEEREAAAAEARDHSWDRRTPLAPAARARRAAEGFDAFAARAAALDERRRLADWIAWLHGFLTDDPWGMRRRIYDVPGGRFDVARLDLAGWRAITTIVDRWREALEHWGGAEDRLDAVAFHAQLQDLLDADVALWSETQRGVQVLEGLAAAYRSFDHVFLVGLEAGRVPLPAPLSPILDEREREALRAAGLPLESREVWDARERELFRVLVAGAGRLTISHAALDPGGRETVPSAFVEALREVATLVGAGDADRIPASRVVTEGVRLCADAVARERALACARIEWERRTGRVSPYNGAIRSPALLAYLTEAFGDARLWSPSQLESYAKCPWAYFSGRLLRMQVLDDPDEEMDDATRGTLLHDALRRFYERLGARGGRPVLLRAADLDRALPLVEESLDAALADARGHRWLGSELLLPAKRAELLRMLCGYVRWEAEENERGFEPRARTAHRRLRTAVVSHEREIREAVLERNGVRFRFRGYVDRVEIGCDERAGDGEFVAAVDYKTSIWSVPGAGKREAWDDGVVLQVPLYAHALTQLHPGARVARVEYRALQTPKRVHALELYRIEKAGGAVVDPEAVARMERALDRVADHVRAARAGDFPARPAPSCGCPRFCHALDVCRVAGGPQVGGW